MIMETDAMLNKLVADYPSLSSVRQSVREAYLTMAEAFAGGHTLYCCGNGGSAADCARIVSELRKRFILPCPVTDEDLIKKLHAYEGGEHIATLLEGGLPAVSLCESLALLSATANDAGEDMVFAQALYGLAKPGDVLLVISASGDAENCVNAAKLAKAMELKVLALTGERGGRLAELADTAIRVPGCVTCKIQELHLPVCNALCAMLEAKFFPPVETPFAKI